MKSSSRPLLQWIYDRNCIKSCNVWSPTARRMKVSCEKTRSVAALDTCIVARILIAVKKYGSASFLSFIIVLHHSYMIGFWLLMQADIMLSMVSKCYLGALFALRRASASVQIFSKSSKNLEIHSSRSAAICKFWLPLSDPSQFDKMPLRCSVDAELCFYYANS